MSEQAEQWARQLLDKTKAGKLEWFPSDDHQFEAFRADIGDGYAFSVQRKTEGNDDKEISFELKEAGKLIFADHVDNRIQFSKVAAYALVDALPGNTSSSESSFGRDPKIAKFRLFSDLFYAARTKAMGGEQTLKKVQELIERL
jgi:hypothetical protein